MKIDWKKGSFSEKTVTIYASEIRRMIEQFVADSVADGHKLRGYSLEYTDDASPRIVVVYRREDTESEEHANTEA